MDNFGSCFSLASKICSNSLLTSSQYPCKFGQDYSLCKRSPWWPQPLQHKSEDFPYLAVITGVLKNLFFDLPVKLPTVLAISYFMTRQASFTPFIFSDYCIQFQFPLFLLSKSLLLRSCCNAL